MKCVLPTWLLRMLRSVSIMCADADADMEMRRRGKNW